MTGYGRGEIEEKGVRVTAELRSLNNRFFEMVAKLPRFLAPLEDEIKKLVQARISRGRILLTLTWEEPGGLAETIVLDKEVADVYYRLLTTLKQTYNLSGDIDVRTFAALPDLLKKEVKEWEPSQAFLLAKEALSIALDDLVEMKETGRRGDRARPRGAGSISRWPRSTRSRSGRRSGSRRCAGGSSRGLRSSRRRASTTKRWSCRK